MLKDKVLNYKLLKIFLLFLLILLPWSFSNNQDAINAKYIDSSTVGYYQINTCDISFIEVLIKNINNNNVNYVFDNYSNIKCFGKGNGVDKIGESFKVGIGTNILINLLIQSFFWLLLISFIKKGKNKTFEHVNISIIFLSGLFMFMSSIVILIIVLINYINNKILIQGWTSTIFLILFFGGLQNIYLGIIGEYLSKTYIETKSRNCVRFWQSPHFGCFHTKLENT